MENGQDFKKLRAERLNNILDHFSNSPAILYTHNTFDSAELPRIYPSNVSNWRKGGYIDKKTGKVKEYITESSARNIILVLNKRMERVGVDTRFRIEYLLGYDDYMTNGDLLKAQEESQTFQSDIKSEILDSLYFMLLFQHIKVKVERKNNSLFFIINKDNKKIEFSEEKFFDIAQHVACYSAFYINDMLFREDK